MTAMTIRVYGKMSDGTIRQKFLSGDYLLQVPYDPHFLIGGTTGKSIDSMIDQFFKRLGVPLSVGIGALAAAGKTYAAEIKSTIAQQNVDAVAVTAKGNAFHSFGDRLMPIINMVQDLALPVGITVASWGMIEMILGNYEAGKHKVKWAIIGFVGMFLIPEVFYAIRDAFSGIGISRG